MTIFDSVRWLERVHGHLGWLAAAALVHPAILLRSPTRRASIAVGAAVALVTCVGALGVVLYGEYRERLKQSIFQQAPSIGYVFERKEHLAFGAIVLAWAGGLAYFAAPTSASALHAPLRMFAFRAFAAASVLAIVAAALGTVVAVYKSF